MKVNKKIDKELVRDIRYLDSREQQRDFMRHNIYDNGLLEGICLYSACAASNFGMILCNKYLNDIDLNFLKYGIAAPAVLLTVVPFVLSFKRSNKYIKLRETANMQRKLIEEGIIPESLEHGLDRI